jgi:hypothetical protein
LTPCDLQGLYVGKGKNWFLGSDPNAQCGIGTKDEWVVCARWFVGPRKASAYETLSRITYSPANKLV